MRTHEIENLKQRRLEKERLALLRRREDDRAYREHLAMIDAGEPIWGMIKGYEREMGL